MSFLRRFFHREHSNDTPGEQGTSKRAVIVSCVLIAGAVCTGIWQNNMSAEAVDSGGSTSISVTSWPHTKGPYNMKRTEWSGAGAATITPVTYNFKSLLSSGRVSADELDTSMDKEETDGPTSGQSGHSGGSGHSGSSGRSSSTSKVSLYGKTITFRKTRTKSRTGSSGSSSAKNYHDEWFDTLKSAIYRKAHSGGGGWNDYKSASFQQLSPPSNGNATRRSTNAIFICHGSGRTWVATIPTTISTSNGRITSYTVGNASFGPSRYNSRRSARRLAAANTVTARAADADDSGDPLEDYEDQQDETDPDDDTDEDSGDDDDEADVEKGKDETGESAFERSYRGSFGTIQYEGKKPDDDPVTKYSTWYLDQGIKTINNVRSEYTLTNKALLFIPYSFMPKGSWKKNIPVEMVSSGAPGKDGIDLTEHRIYGNAKVYADDINPGVDTFTKGSPVAQRKENLDVLKDHVMTDSGTGVFSGYLHKLFREENHSKWESDELTGDTGNKYKIHDHDKLFKNLRKHESDLLKEAQKSGYYEKAKLYYGLAVNVYKSGSKYYMCPQTIDDYAALSAFNYLKNSTAAKDDLKKIKDNNTKSVKFYGAKVHTSGSKDKRYDRIQDDMDRVKEQKCTDSKSTESDVYNYYHLNGSASYKNIKDFKARVGQSRINSKNYDCGQYSQVASYANNEYAVAYIDTLLCGYNIAYRKQKSVPSNAPKAEKKAAADLVGIWGKAIRTELEESDTFRDTGNMVSLNIDAVGGTYSQARKTVSLASFGSYAMGTYGARAYVPLYYNEKSKGLNPKSVSQSFYGVTGGTRTEKIDSHSPWYDKMKYTKVTNAGKQVYGRNGVKTIKDGLEVGDVYKRIYKAASKKKNGTPEYVNDDNSWAYITWSQNVIDNNKVKDSKRFSGAMKRARSGEMLYDRLDNIHKYTYGTFRTSPVALYRIYTKQKIEKPTTFELRVHSEKANGTAKGAVLTDNNYPDGIGKLQGNDGSGIHDTAETAGGTKSGRGITITKNGAQVMQDRISLKIDSTNNDGIFDKLQDKNVKIVVQYEIGTANEAKYDPTKSNDEEPEKNMQLKDMSKAQDKENILDDANKKSIYTYISKSKIKVDSINSKADDNREDFTPKNDTVGSEKPKPKDGEDANTIHYEEKNEQSKSVNNLMSTYYGQSDKGWPKTKTGKFTYKNLVWQQGFTEMADTGFTFTVPDSDKWEHYYRICIKAKIGVFKPGSDSSVYDEPYFINDDGKDMTGWKDGYTETNPVYVTYHVTKNKPDDPDEFYGNSGTISNYDSALQHGYAEFKEGSVYNETFEAMAGVPTTRTMYFATGGEEFIINLQAVYDDYIAKKGSGQATPTRGNIDHDAYKTSRLYTVHFRGVDCEYKEGDTFKELASGQKKSEPFKADSDGNDNEHQVTAEANNAVDPEGAKSFNTKVNGHDSETRFEAKWEGTRVVR